MLSGSLDYGIRCIYFKAVVHGFRVPYLGGTINEVS
jgi:hypothetical protein